ncbi:MAG TPA: CDP-diacylglycerol--serine O-phosphatidyltransferase [Syntrophomonas sp.]|nr:CDP-diacylglycerol--serine O-phosphatidyltransferase [Syntrophomonas sp.]
MASLIFRNFNNIITLFNLLFGSLSILYTIEGEYGYAAISIILAVVMDSMDGRVARKLHTASELGKELDSLCDLVSFGVAPSILIYTQVFGSFNSLIAKVAIVAALLYIICGALRLARFNVMNCKDFFLGVPITLAGALMAVISFFSAVIPELVILVIILTLAFLMVSNFKVPKL